MLMKQSTYSQGTSQNKEYPKEVVINGDTLVIITLDDAREINQTYLDAEYYEVVSDSLGKKIIIQNARIKNDSLIISNKSFQIDNLNETIFNNSQIIDRQKSDLEDTDDELKKEKGKNKSLKKIAKGSVILNVIFIIVAFIGVVQN